MFNYIYFFLMFFKQVNSIGTEILFSQFKTILSVYVGHYVFIYNYTVHLFNSYHNKLLFTIDPMNLNDNKISFIALN